MGLPGLPLRAGGKALGKACSSFQKCHFSPICFAQIYFGKRHFCHFSPTTKRRFSPHFAPRKKVPFFAKKILKNRLDLTHSPKLDHFSQHFAPRKVQFFAIFSFAKKVPFFAAFRSAKKSAVFREKNREKQARPKQGLGLGQNGRLLGGSDHGIKIVSGGVTQLGEVAARRRRGVTRAAAESRGQGCR